jgi:hypothetical protein
MRTSFRLCLLPALALSAAGCLAIASDAMAATEVASEVALVQTPRLFGPGLAYVEAEGTDGRVVLRGAAPGAPVRDLASGFIRDTKCNEEDCNSEGFLFDAARTPGRVAYSKVTTQTLTQGPRSFSLSTAGLNGPFDELLSCTKASDIDIYGYSVDADAIAYQADSCVDGAPGTRVVVRDFAAGASAPVSYPVAADADFDLAGNVLAIVTPDSSGSDKSAVKVIDWTTGATLYAATIADRVFAFDAQADGKVVVGIPTTIDKEKGPPLPGRTRPTRCNVTIDWLSAAEPKRHPLGACGTGAVQIEGDRIFFVRDDNKTTQIAQSDLAGKLTTVVSLKPSGLLPSTSSRIGADEFDVDGSRIGYAVSRCLGESLYVQDLPAPAAKDETVSCPTSFPSNRLKVTKTGTVKLPLSCQKGCTGSLKLYRLLTDGSGAIDYIAGSIPEVRLEGGTKKLTVKLSKKALKAIKKRGKVVVSTQLFGPPFGTERNITLVK